MKNVYIQNAHKTALLTLPCAYYVRVIDTTANRGQIISPLLAKSGKWYVNTLKLFFRDTYSKQGRGSLCA